MTMSRFAKIFLFFFFSVNDLINRKKKTVSCSPIDRTREKKNKMKKCTLYNRAYNIVIINIVYPTRRRSLPKSRSFFFFLLFPFRSFFIYYRRATDPRARVVNERANDRRRRRTLRWRACAHETPLARRAHTHRTTGTAIVPAAPVS